MLYISILNILIYFSIQIAKVKFYSSFFSKKNYYLNPFIIAFIFSFPIEIAKIIIGPAILIDNGLADKYFIFSIFIANIGELMDYFLIRVACMVSKRYVFTFKSISFNIKPERMKIAAWLFYLFYLVFFLLLASNQFGVLNWIRDPRTGYQLYRTGAGQFWVFAISCLSVSYTLVALYAKRISTILIVFIPVSYSIFLLGSKGLILSFFIFLLTVLWLRNFKYLKISIVGGIIMSSCFLIANFFWNADTIEIKDLFSYFDYYANSAMYYKAYFSNNIDLFYGKIFISDVWNLVPRALYPDKPYVYGFLYVNEYFFPGAAELTNTPAFGGPMPFFADFGILGVILFSFFNIGRFVYNFFLFQLLQDYGYEKITRTSDKLILFIFFTAPNFLFLVPFPFSFVFLLFVIVLIIFHNNIVLRYSPHRSSSLGSQ